VTKPVTSNKKVDRRLVRREVIPRLPFHRPIIYPATRHSTPEQISQLVVVDGTELGHVITD
jgi:hypothetical protein